jgi:hypothetical protein
MLMVFFAILGAGCNLIPPEDSRVPALIPSDHAGTSRNSIVLSFCSFLDLEGQLGRFHLVASCEVVMFSAKARPVIHRHLDQME